jgi:hypothetical protein
VPGQGKPGASKVFLIFENFVNRKLISLHKFVGQDNWSTKNCLSLGMTSVFPRLCMEAEEYKRQLLGPSRRVREAHPRDGDAVFRLHHSTQDDMLLFGDVKYVTFHKAWTKYLK